jgi:hypothetical protein
MKKFVPVTFAAVALAGGIAAGSAFAFPPAPSAPPVGFTHAAFGPEGGPAAGPQHGRPGARPHMERKGGHERFGTLEQRTERMKARLQITDAQKPQWDAVVGVMQKQAKAFASARAEFWQKKANGETPKVLTTPERMAQRNKAMETRLNSQREFTAAYSALYNTMSPEQKKMVDDHLSARRHRG